ncbi:MAG TPA: alpha/beta fold hydrolase [Rhodanobacteraceae bacterium]|nr:alpha/beta fold hydrolase [Rhodanobacteraceae bacterium]
MKLGGKRNGAWIAIAVAIAVPILQMRHNSARGEPPPAVQPPVPSGAQPLDVLKLGSLTLKPCELTQPGSAATTAAYCAPFEVPENRADPHSRKIRLKLAIVKSDAQVAAKDLVVYLAGGPGEAATQSYAQIAPAFAPLRRHHDILLLDQRGTGGSHPLDCPEAARAMQASSDQPFDARRVREQTARCLAEVDKTSDPRYYTTTDAVADLEAVRQALGDPTFDLVGISYGTRMAQQYARAHPDAVRSIVLDGVVPNQLILGEDFATNLERALKLQSDACVAAPACKAAFGDPFAAVHALHDKLRAQAAQATFPNPKTFQPMAKPVTADTLASVVRLFSYNAETAALLPLTVAQAEKGDYTPLMGQAQILAGSLDTAMNTGMQLSVICTEDADLLQPRPQDAGTILGSEIVEAVKAECAVWPHGAPPTDFHAPFRSSIPTLLLSGERDPVTPPRYADEVLRGLSDARSLVAGGMGHSILVRGCVPKLVDQFVTDLQPKKLDAGCVRQIGPVPAFVNFNGAAP